MHLSPTRFNAHLKAMGQNFSWRRANSCPCVNPSSGAAKQDCAVCDGRGVVWGAETDVRIGMTAQNSRKAPKDFGTYEAGDSILSIGSDQACYGCGRYDRFRAKDSSNAFSINLRRGFADKVRFPVKEFDRVFWLNDAEQVVEGGLPTLDEETGVLSWTSGAPPQGRFFSISGTRWDEYYAYLDLPQDRNAGISNLPRKLPVRRMDLFTR